MDRYPTFNMFELITKLRNGEEFTSSNKIKESRLNQIYYYFIVRNQDEAIHLMSNPEEDMRYIVVTPIIIGNKDIDFPVSCNRWIFAKPITFINLRLRKPVQFINSIFLQDLDFYRVTLTAPMLFQFSTIVKGNFGLVFSRRKAGISFERVDVIDSFNINHSNFDASFSFSTRGNVYHLKPDTPITVFNFSHSRFNKYTLFDFFSYTPQFEFVIVLDGCSFRDELDIYYEFLKRNKFKNIIFNDKLYTQYIADSFEKLEDRVVLHNSRIFKPNESIKYYMNNTIKGSFASLLEYYKSKDIDKMLDLLYFYKKYENNLILYKHTVDLLGRVAVDKDGLIYKYDHARRRSEWLNKHIYYFPLKLKLYILRRLRRNIDKDRVSKWKILRRLKLDIFRMLVQTTTSNKLEQIINWIYDIIYDIPTMLKMLRQNVLNRLRWLFSYTCLDLGTKYFTSWGRVLVSTMVIIFFFFSIFLFFADHIEDSNGNSLASEKFYINVNDRLDIDRIVNVIYFTLITFTTIGYGDYHPTGFLKILAGIEGLLGITLTSIFTVTLAKRILG